MGACYRPPHGDIEAFNNKIHEVLLSCQTREKCVYLAGDFNLDLMKRSIKSLIQTFMDVMSSCALLPLITKPTRITPTSKSLIDNIFTNNFVNDHTSYIVLCDISDHLPLITSINVTRKATEIQKHISRCFSARNIFDKSFPLKCTCKSYKTRLTWITQDLKKILIYKNKLYRLSLKRATQVNILKYKDCKKLLNGKLHRVKRDYYNNKMLQDTCDKKNYWKYIKELINKDDSNQYPDHFIIDKIPITDKKKISNSFNDFFTNIGPTLADKIKSGDIEHMHYLKNPTNKSMFLEPTYGHEIRTTIKNLKNSAAGFDGYNLKVINAILNVILSPIVHIVNFLF